MTSAGCEIRETCDELISVMCESARCAIISCAAPGMILSWRPIASHDGMVFQAGALEGWASAASEVGLCVAISRACSAGGTSRAKSALTMLGSR